MLLLTRKPGEIIRIFPQASIDPRTPLRDLFGQRPIEIVVSRIEPTQVRLGIEADPLFVILRGELSLKHPGYAQRFNIK